MYKEIPYYGKSSIKSIKEIEKDNYILEIYKDSENIITKIVHDNKKNIDSQYKDTINEYLENKKEAYLLSKDIINNNTVIKRSKNMALASAITVISLPILSLATSSVIFLAMDCIAVVLSAPTILYAYRELKYKTDTNKIKMQIEKYEELKQELERLNKEVETTKFRKVDSIKMNNNIKTNNKKKIYGFFVK